MQSKVRHLHQDRRGRFHARMSVPKELRQIIGKRELIRALGGDRKVALRALPKIIVSFQDTLDAARHKLWHGSTKETISVLQTPLTIDQIAAEHYTEQLKLDDQLRDSSRGYARVGLDDGYIADVKSIYSGSATTELIEDIFGNAIETFRKRGVHNFQRSSSDWRRLATRLALSELEVMKRMFERDEGSFVTEQPDWVKEHKQKTLTEAKDKQQREDDKYTLLELFKMCRRSKTGSTELKDKTSKTFLKPIKDFIEFAKTDKPGKITNRKISQWIEHLQFEAGLSPKTIKSKYLPTVRHTLTWAANQGYIEPMTLTASISVPKKKYDREKGYTESEAAAVLQFARDYKRSERSRESHQLSAAKRWAPWLTYFTGARIGEVTQLRKQDVRTENGISFIHITPEAGTTKTGAWRDVPIHPQILEQGFLKFVEEAPDGPLFFPHGKPDQDLAGAAATISQRVGKWIKGANLVPKGVAPNHGFRHAFKTLARRYDIPTEYMHAIQGHSTETAGQEYGNVDLPTMKREIEKLPWVPLTKEVPQAPLGESDAVHG